MTARHDHGDPHLREEEPVPQDLVELIGGRLSRAGKPSWATFTNPPPRNAVPPRVTERDRASIDAAVAAGRVRRVGFDGKEIV